MIMSLTAREFSKLPSDEKLKRYEELSSHEQFIYRTQYDPIDPKPTGKRLPERTEKQKKKDKETLMKFIERYQQLEKEYEQKLKKEYEQK